MQLNSLGKFFKTWYPAILMMIIIFIFSSFASTESDRQSGLVVNVLTLIFPDAKDLEFTVKLVRKTAHFTEYALLGFLSARAFGLSNHHPLHSIWLSALYATSDEIHQYFVPGRSMQFTDILIDSAGATFGALLYFITHKKALKRAG